MLNIAKQRRRKGEWERGLLECNVPFSLWKDKGGGQRRLGAEAPSSSSRKREQGGTRGEEKLRGRYQSLSVRHP